MFPRSDQLARHFRKHTWNKPFRCGCCNKAFARKDNLSLHLKCHTELL
ncbi:unnamed protein product [Larinioides sclopetarius]|uniref:C2H2-type domain-containing protein n=1 Tax=Larinioides sclopetarius TaxID=280406 RepID=A0AAV2AYR0_9ARAC